MRSSTARSTGAAGDLPYRLYRPPTEGPHPDRRVLPRRRLGAREPRLRRPVLPPAVRRSPTRSSCRSTIDTLPRTRFPAAADDAVAAVQWVAGNAADLGGVPGKLAVCGWSAGGNVAAVAAQAARDAGGPALSGQVLINPVTDSDLTRESYQSNGDGYMLTTDLMKWFWDHYADEADRTDPRAAPLRAADLSGLPPALVVTCEFDPLADEGAAYARGPGRCRGRDPSPRVRRTDPHVDHRRRHDHVGGRRARRDRRGAPSDVRRSSPRLTAHGAFGPRRSFFPSWVPQSGTHNGKNDRWRRSSVGRLRLAGRLGVDRRFGVGDDRLPRQLRERRAIPSVPGSSPFVAAMSLLRRVDRHAVDGHIGSGACDGEFDAVDVRATWWARRPA